MMIMATKIAPLTPAQLAAELGTDARTTRKFLRSITPREAQPGKGSRWEIAGTAASVRTMRKQFAAFTAAQDEAKAKRNEAKAIADAPQIEQGDDEAIDALDELEGPSDEEMLAEDN
jgi:hypothetical protein